MRLLGYDEATNTIAYEGSIHTDGYGVYDAVASKFGLRHGGCLTHATARHLTPIGQAIRKESLQAEELQADETPIDVHFYKKEEYQAPGKTVADAVPAALAEQDYCSAPFTNSESLASIVPRCSETAPNAASSRHSLIIESTSRS